jgi:hypothetical protein
VAAGLGVWGLLAACAGILGIQEPNEPAGDGAADDGAAGDGAGPDAATGAEADAPGDAVAPSDGGLDPCDGCQSTRVASGQTGIVDLVAISGWILWARNAGNAGELWGCPFSVDRGCQGLQHLVDPDGPVVALGKDAFSGSRVVYSTTTGSVGSYDLLNGPGTTYTGYRDLTNVSVATSIDHGAFYFGGAARTATANTTSLFVVPNATSGIPVEVERENDLRPIHWVAAINDGTSDIAYTVRPDYTIQACTRSGDSGTGCDVFDPMLICGTTPCAASKAFPRVFAASSALAVVTDDGIHVARTRAGLTLPLEENVLPSALTLDSIDIVWADSQTHDVWQQALDGQTAKELVASSSAPVVALETIGGGVCVADAAGTVLFVHH